MSVVGKDTAVTPDAAAIEFEQTRLASAFWRQWRGRDTAKHLAQALNISVSYAKKLLDCEKPLRGRLKTTAELVWGKQFVALMLQPYGDWTLPYRIGAELEAIKARTAELEAETRRLFPGVLE